MNIIYEKCFNKEGQLIEGPLIIKPKIYFDERGFFQESWNKKNFNKVLLENGQKEETFVQDNHSKSVKGTLRGLHYQKDPNAQGKLVRCLNGEVFDVAVDLRKSSKTFLNYTFVNLSGKNQNQFWIPKGFAHGFLTLSDIAIVEYKVDNFWSKENERSLIWDDEFINISWPLKKINHMRPKLSKKDLLGVTIKTLQKSNEIFK